MDMYLNELIRHLSLCEQLLRERSKKVSREPTGGVRYQARVTHTLTMYHLVQELRGIAEQDPDKWDDEPDLVPF